MKTRSPTRSPRHGAAVSVALVLAVFAAGCGASRGATDSIERHGGGIVLKGTALTDGQGTVLDALRGKVPSFRVQRGLGKCPRITLRSDASFMSQVNPVVYVDGTRTTDTCILESLQTRDIESVEVYPTGVTRRPGYGIHAHGLILLFMRS